MRTIEIIETKNAIILKKNQISKNPCFLLILLCLVLIYMVIFSMPLASMFYNKIDIKISTVLIGSFICFFGWLTGLLVLRLLIRSLLSYTINIKNENGEIIIEKTWFKFIKYQKYVKNISSVIVMLAYQRGDWGYQIRLRLSEGKNKQVIYPILISNSINEAMSEGELVGRKIANALNIEKIEFIGWDKFIKTAEKMKHDQG